MLLQSPNPSTLPRHSTAIRTARTRVRLQCRTHPSYLRPSRRRRMLLQRLTPQRLRPPRRSQTVRPLRTQARARSGRGARTVTRAPVPRRRAKMPLQKRHSRRTVPRRLRPSPWVRQTRSSSHRPSLSSKRKLRRRRPTRGTLRRLRLSLRSAGRSRAHSWRRCELGDTVVVSHVGYLVVSLNNIPAVDCVAEVLPTLVSALVPMHSVLYTLLLCPCPCLCSRPRPLSPWLLSPLNSRLCPGTALDLSSSSLGTNSVADCQVRPARASSCHPSKDEVRGRSRARGHRHGVRGLLLARKLRIGFAMCT